MKYLILSDIHGSIHYGSMIKNIIEKEKSDKLILLGDLYYHGPRNPLPKEYAPMEVCKLLNSMKSSLVAIRGNCDAEVDEMISEFKFISDYVVEINGKTFWFTHGHKYNIDNIPENVDFLVYGHFHTGYIKEKDGVVCVNAGSMSLPKNNTPHSYVVITEEEVLLKDIDGNLIDKVQIK